MTTPTEQVIHHAEVAVPTEEPLLRGILTVPHHAEGAVVFAHGAGSSRRSPRNQQVASPIGPQPAGDGA